MWQSGVSSSPPPPHPLVVDCDPGIDDLVALALAARSPEVRLAAVTTTWGNATLARTTRNARHVLNLAGRPDVPVLAGTARPLVRDPVTAPETHGPEGAGYASVGEADQDIRGRGDVLLQVLARVGVPMTLVTLGPLTNLAQAIRSAGPPLGRSALKFIRRHLAMAGSCAVGRADFNAWADPEALDIVLGAGLGTELVPLDVTRHTVIPAPAIEHFAASPDPLVRWLVDALRWYAEARHRRSGTAGCAVHDVLPVAEAVAPGLLDFGSRRLKIGVGDDANRGRTTPDPDGARCRIATGADQAGVRHLLVRVFGTGWDRTLDGGT